MKILIKILINLCVLFTVVLGILKLVGISDSGWISVFTPLLFAMLVLFIAKKLKL
jgi:hypothetical protein